MGVMSEGDLRGAAVVFDLDGTLVDSAPDLVRALNRTLDLEGLPAASVADVRRFMGRGAKRLIERSAGLAGVGFSPERLERLTDAFIGFYSAEIAVESTPFPGVRETLTSLAGAGAALTVCTNKRTNLSRQLLEALGLAEHFTAIVGADAVANRKPHPDHYREAVARAGGRLSRSLMVGDTAADIDAAKGAGARSVAVRFGYSEAAVESLGADAVIAHFFELPTAVRRLLSDVS
jgi:phosphoglycolate phosphatase